MGRTGLRETLTVDIDTQLLRRMEVEAKKAGRSPASYVESLVGRAVLGRDYSDVEIIAAVDVGHGTVMRGEDESREEYDRRRRSVALLRNLGKA